MRERFDPIETLTSTRKRKIKKRLDSEGVKFSNILNLDGIVQSCHFVSIISTPASLAPKGVSLYKAYSVVELLRLDSGVRVIRTKNMVSMCHKKV